MNGTSEIAIINMTNFSSTQINCENQEKGLKNKPG